MNIDEAFETVREALEDGVPDREALAALDTIREELEREGAIQARFDARLTQAYGTIAHLRTQLERQEAALELVRQLVAFPFGDPKKADRMVPKIREALAALSTPPNQENPEELNKRCCHGRSNAECNGTCTDGEGCTPPNQEDERCECYADVDCGIHSPNQEDENAQRQCPGPGHSGECDGL